MTTYRIIRDDRPIASTRAEDVNSARENVRANFPDVQPLTLQEFRPSAFGEQVWIWDVAPQTSRENKKP